MAKISKNYEIFISYRRKGGYDTAKLIYDRLRLEGYSVSFDIDTLVNGNFDTELEQRVNNCKDFLLVLSPGVFDRFFTDDPNYDLENDWVRREIACALKANKNIVPLMLDGFVFPQTLPDNVKDITKKNAIDFHQAYFEAAYAKMKSFMISKPSVAVKHKNKILSAVTIILAIAALLIYQTNKKLEETKIIAERERIQLADSLKTLDSIRKQRIEMRNKPRTYHWNGADSGVAPVIFEKLQRIEFQKTECTGRGLIVTPNRANCREDAKNPKAKKYICFYSPRITFTTCDNRPYTFFEKNKRLRSSPQTSEAAAREELLNELRDMDFSDWILEIKDFK